MPGGPGQRIANIPKTFTESVVKPAGDQLAEAVEQGVSDTFGFSVKPPKPAAQKLQQDPVKKADEDRRKQNIIKYFDSLKMNANTYRQQQEEALNIKRHQELEEKHKIRQFQFEQKQKQKQPTSIDVYRAQRKGEIKIKTG